MLKKMTTLALFAAALGAAANVYADTYSGRVTAFSPTSISVFDKNVATVAMNGNTAFTKLITQKPWQDNSRVDYSALAVGRYVVVHEENGVADWVQIATDFPVFSERAYAYTPPAGVTPFEDEAAAHRAEAKARRAAPTASESKRPGSVDTAAYCERRAHEAEKAGK